MSTSTAAHGHTALGCLAEVARKRGINITLERILHDNVVGEEEPANDNVLKIAQKIGLKAKATTLDWEHLRELKQAFPVIVRLKNGNSMVVTGFGTQGATPVVLLQDPLAGPDVLLPVDEQRFTQAWGGDVILLKRDHAGDGVSDEPFGIRWFLREIVRQRRIFRDVAVAALLLSALGLALPIFMQLVLDRVLVHQSFDTLKVLLVGIGIAILFETIFSYLRQYMLLHAARKIDSRLNVQTFNKLISLPMDFFERTPSGMTLKNIQQTEKVRGFLTGPLFVTLLDSVALMAFIPMLLFYSTELTMVVIGFTLLLAINVGIIIPLIKSRLSQLYMAEVRLQSYMIETIQGMRTVKSLALDAKHRKEWDHRVARAVDMRFDVGKVFLFAQSISGPIEKAMMITVLGLGAYLVFDGQLTVGALIAFNMMSGRVVQPLVQMASLIQQFQEISLSIKMMGTIMNQESEQGRTGSGVRAPLKGGVEFHEVRFRYASGTAPALDGVSFKIQPGQIFGIMGRSGSGKTTVTRLLQGLHSFQEGMIRIDGYDIREIDLDHLRSSIGVVLQENFLFTGTIRDNIAAAKSHASMEEVMRAARLAGADEFIERLPKGFDTMLEEGSANLSGGQRQRLAIARALLTDPRLLILDEATSALDAESEAIVQANLMSIARGRSVIIISHRLSSLVPSDAILVLDRGKVMDIGRHQELLDRCGIYKHLWSQQNRAA